jgi:hypothetical protein
MPKQPTPALRKDQPAGDHLSSALLQSYLAERPSVAERRAAGKALREKVPRGAHAEYQPSPAREDPVAILEAQAKTRLPNLVPVRYARMLASPFAFLRGEARS